MRPIRLSLKYYIADNEFCNLFLGVKLREMKSCLFPAPHSFDDDEVDEDIQLALMEFSCVSALKENVSVPGFFISTHTSTLLELVLHKFALLIRSPMTRKKSSEISHTRLLTTLKRYQPGKSSENRI